MNCEINGNLEEIDNFNLFYKNIILTIMIFINTFGEDVMGRLDLYVDNATSGSGYTPITTVILKKYITIKLGINNFKNEEQTVYQFSHELCHYVFYSLKGINKEKANREEENICSAMSLVVINMLFPKSTEKWTIHVANLKNNNYNKGAEIAQQIDYDIVKLKHKIYQFCNISER